MRKLVYTVSMILPPFPDMGSSAGCVLPKVQQVKMCFHHLGPCKCKRVYGMRMALNLLICQ